MDFSTRLILNKVPRTSVLVSTVGAIVYLWLTKVKVCGSDNDYLLTQT